MRTRSSSATRRGFTWPPRWERHVVSIFPPTITPGRFAPWRTPGVMLGDHAIACAGWPRARVSDSGTTVYRSDRTRRRRRRARRALPGTRDVNILIWHVHGAWTTAFVRGRHRYFVPLVPDRSSDGRGRAPNVLVAGERRRNHRRRKPFDRLRPSRFFSARKSSANSAGAGSAIAGPVTISARSTSSTMRRPDIRTRCGTTSPIAATCDSCTSRISTRCSGRRVRRERASSNTVSWFPTSGMTVRFRVPPSSSTKPRAGNA